MIDFPMPNDEQRQQTKDRFAAAARLRELESASEESRPVEAIAPSRLYVYATGPAVADPELDARLRKDHNLRRVYRRMIESSAVYHLPEAMAASTGAPPERHGRNCRIRLEPARAEETQVYVIVEIDAGAEVQPETLTICDRDENCFRFALTGFKNGVCQLIAERDSDLLNLLIDPTTEAYLQ